MPPSLSLAFRTNPYTGVTPRSLVDGSITKFVIIRGSVVEGLYREPTNGELTALIGGVTITHRNLICDILAERFEKIAELRAFARQIVVGGGTKKNGDIQFGSATLADLGGDEVPTDESVDDRRRRCEKHDRPESPDEQAEILRQFREAICLAIERCSMCRQCKDGAYLGKDS